MDDVEDESYPGNSYGYGSLNKQKPPQQKTSYRVGTGNRYVDDEVEDDEEDEDFAEDGLNGDGDGDEDEDEDEEDGEGEGGETNGVQRVGNNHRDGDEDDEENDDDQKRKDYKRRIEDIDFDRHPKKRKLMNLISNYEFAPRAAQPSAASSSAPKPISGGRNILSDWTEHETSVLLDSWGDKFLKHGRKSLRAEEWQEVAERVSQESKIERTDTQCRNRLDTLKKKYKKEKLRLTNMGEQTSKWVHFKKMDTLMSPNPRQSGLSCGLDSGEYVFTNPRVYLNRANGLDEMRDSPGNSESSEGEGDDSDGLPPGRRNSEGRDDSYKLLADCIHKFTGIYEKVERTKRQQIGELEKMRMDFYRDLEVQKQQILERGQAEIAKLQQDDDDDDDDDEEENDISAENISG